MRIFKFWNILYLEYILITKVLNHFLKHKRAEKANKIYVLLCVRLATLPFQRLLAQAPGERGLLNISSATPDMGTLLTFCQYEPLVYNLKLGEITLKAEDKYHGD